MTHIVYTQAVRQFADMHEGLGALQAVVEKEIEYLRELDLDPMNIACCMLSWHGDNNLVMVPQPPDLIVDMVDTDPDPKIIGSEALIEQKPVAESESNL